MSPPGEEVCLRPAGKEVLDRNSTLPEGSTEAKTMDVQTIQGLGVVFGLVGTLFIFVSRRYGQRLLLWLGIVLVVQSALLYFWPLLAGY